MDFVTVVGVGASVLTSTSLIPQVIKIIKEKRSENISLITLCALFAGHCLWIYYGVLKSDLIIVVSNSFAGSVDIVTFVLGIRYNGKQRR